ncbi:UDP-N-acetylglucosamine 2-epimerase [Escherichia albertii]|uniref:Predicted UDP-N-acetylglucosamine 2-epimerase n=1 Tax=Escherichia albertii TaxID=208962 RepID=A0A5A4U8U3_ESCAL|nr:UDP-N-acetylglucosamine 2-epimerase [Escherichia albertii]MCZ8641290.1 UDP-N-acetylglucosamine 2-epimerase [Escherichia albertii]MCZ9211461.1 UDP-N-acetylglucosamine 2-epimerase [Escherichia albertii]BBM62868.1 predicted UDP-N-acetylglucosamine 2-epimerase [Escherichia albertii]
MKKILYVTGSRAEYGIMKRLLLRLANEDNIQLSIIATGMHCDERYGHTYKFIENDGFTIDKLIDINISNNSNADILYTMARCQSEFAAYFRESEIDALIILGDRYEIFSVAIAAAMHCLPIIHLHGGEKTLGNYDEFIRHSITKMSSLHLASTEEYRKRIIQLGEDPKTVFNIGSLGAENAALMKLPTKEELEYKYGALSKPYFVIVFHPETLNPVSPDVQVDSLLMALDKIKDKYDFIFIGANADTGANKIQERIESFCKKNNSRLLTSILPEDYLALNKYSNGIVGNSSSGLIEVPTLGVPTINIGDRQKGRVRGASVFDCPCEAESIYQAIKESQNYSYSGVDVGNINPYFKKGTLERAVYIIKDFLNNNVRARGKDFYDIEFYC